MRSAPIHRRRSLVIALAAVVGMAGCSSGSDEASPDVGSASASTVAGSDSASTVPTAAAPTVASAPVAVPADTAEDATANDSADSAEAAECGGLSAAEIGAAVGTGEFDSADDISVDGDTSCLFSNSTGIYGIVVSTEPTATYLAGDLDGASTDDALTSLEAVLTFSLGDPTVTRVDVGGHQATMVSGSLVTGGTGAKIGTIVDGTVVTVEADGSDLASDQAGFESIVTDVLDLATSDT